MVGLTIYIYALKVFVWLSQLHNNMFMMSLLPNISPLPASLFSTLTGLPRYHTSLAMFPVSMFSTSTGLLVFYRNSFIYAFSWHGPTASRPVQYTDGFSLQLYTMLNKVCEIWLVLEYIKYVKHITQNFEFNPWLTLFMIVWNYSLCQKIMT